MNSPEHKFKSYIQNLFHIVHLNALTRFSNILLTTACAKY